MNQHRPIYARIQAKMDAALDNMDRHIPKQRCKGRAVGGRRYTKWRNVWTSWEDRWRQEQRREAAKRPKDPVAEAKDAARDRVIM